MTKQDTEPNIGDVIRDWESRISNMENELVNLQGSVFEVRAQTTAFESFSDDLVAMSTGLTEQANIAVANTLENADLHKAHADIAGSSALDVIRFSGVGRTQPVDPFEIASKLGIIVVDNDRNTSVASGRIDVLPDGKVQIWVNPRHHIHRQRFTVAHELGHYVRDILPCLLDNEATTGFEDGELTYHRSNMDDKPEEVAANLFASELLMPAKAVAKYSDSESLNDMARHFKVSVKAMKRRLNYLGQ